MPYVSTEYPVISFSEDKRREYVRIPGYDGLIEVRKYYARRPSSLTWWSARPVGASGNINHYTLWYPEKTARNRDDAIRAIEDALRRRS